MSFLSHQKFKAYIEIENFTFRKSTRIINDTWNERNTKKETLFENVLALQLFCNFVRIAGKWKKSNKQS